MNSSQLAVCSWSLRPESPAHLAGLLRELGLDAVQLALNAHRGSAGGAAVGETLRAAGVRIVSGMFGAVGEDYSTLESIRLTGGFVPDATWDENLALATAAADAAQALGLDLVSTHAGFLPEDPGDPAYAKLAARVERIAAVFAARGLRLALETGQEEARHLDHFLRGLNARNVGVNFDPANMILYAKGDPTEALEILLPHLYQVHIKDAVATTTPGTWGAEKPVGEGQVDWPAFLGVLDRAGYAGALCIEREAGPDRVADIRRAAAFINRHINSNS
ncbi:MAG: sugar phosphate isomerase/epimerase [Akkermansiaceae bacterium]|nr:sugar phosphate isomerase/epimerase [Akkermansiaceae bacterium]